jgi:hypothetical protein
MGCVTFGTFYIIHDRNAVIRSTKQREIVRRLVFVSYLRDSRSVKEKYLS